MFVAGGTPAVHGYVRAFSPATAALLNEQEILCEEGRWGDALLHQDTLSQMFKGRGRMPELMLQSHYPNVGSLAERLFPSRAWQHWLPIATGTNKPQGCRGVMTGRKG